MPLLIKWKPVDNAEKIYVHQSTSRFTMYDIGVRQDIVTTELPGTATELECAVPRGTVAYFLVSAEDADGLIVYDQCFPSGNFPTSGAGPQDIIRGDWEFGIFGEVSTEELFSKVEIGTMLRAAGKTDSVTAGNTFTKWVKCIVNGKIIYVPDMYFFTPPQMGNKATFLENAGLGLTTGFVTCPIFSKNGFDYKYRLPLMTTDNGPGLLPAIWKTAPPLTDDTVIKSEMGMVAALRRNLGNVPRDAIPPGSTTFNLYQVLDDLRVTPTGTMQQLMSANLAVSTTTNNWTVAVHRTEEAATTIFSTLRWDRVINASGRLEYGAAPEILPILELQL